MTNHNQMQSGNSQDKTQECDVKQTRLVEGERDHASGYEQNFLLEWFVLV